MQRLRNFPFSSAFQRGAAAPTPDQMQEEKRAAAAANAKALWPDNKAILPDTAAPDGASEKATRPSKSPSREPKPARSKRALRLPPAPPMGSLPPLADEPLCITPSFDWADNATATDQRAEKEADTPLLLTEPLTISPQFSTVASAENNKTPDDDMPTLAIAPQGLGAAPVDEKLLANLTAALHANLGSLRDVRSQLAEQCVELALAAARSIAGHAIAADSLHVLRSRLPELLVPQADAPPLQISVCPEDEMAARALISSMAQAQGYEGQIIIEADARLERGDATVNWRQYGWRALVAERRANVEASVSRYLAALQDSQWPDPQGAAPDHG